MAEFRLVKGSVQERFMNSRAKVQLFAGGYAGGKTATMCVKALMLIEKYPGMNVLMARSTYPKLTDTLLKEFVKWCPESWIESYTKGPPTTIVLKNGTTINFRYVSQQAKQEGGTSNLLSATYDLIVFDQIEDPEISEKDFLDLLGRLRGMTRYHGEDMSMPLSGPRWFLISCNPSRNWVYRKLVKPLQQFAESGYRSPELMVDNKGNPIIDLIEGSTYDNAENLEADYIQTLEAAYKGQMRDRFLLGKWAAYEGLIYPKYDERIHRVSHNQMVRYLRKLRMLGHMPKALEGYDHGIAKESCYLLSFADHQKNVLVLDGFYQREQAIGDSANAIMDLREQYDFKGDTAIFADPAVFRRGAGDKKVVGRTVAEIYQECGIWMRPGNNEVINGIAKVSSYIEPLETHRNPFTGAPGSPHIYFSDKLDFVDKEITDYYWAKTPDNDNDDKPVDRNDHAMDTLKYMLSEEPTAPTQTYKAKETPDWMYWHEKESDDGDKVPVRRRVG